MRRQTDGHILRVTFALAVQRENDEDDCEVDDESDEGSDEEGLDFVRDGMSWLKRRASLP